MDLGDELGNKTSYSIIVIPNKSFGHQPLTRSLKRIVPSRHGTGAENAGLQVLMKSPVTICRPVILSNIQVAGNPHHGVQMSISPGSTGQPGRGRNRYHAVIIKTPRATT